MRRRFMSNKHVVYNQAEYLSFEALEDGFMLSFPQNLRYSVNGGVWKNLPYNVYTKPINNGDIISLQGDCEIPSYSGIGTFIFNKKCNVFGNILSITGYKILHSWQFYRLFQNGTIVDGGNLILPATTLTDFCYHSMFQGCTSLTTTPALPAIELAYSCYSYMFQGCTSLVNAPRLPATTLAEDCYVSMFYGCTSLVNAPRLPATTLASSCYNSMFYGCTSLVNAPELPATTLALSCYNSMFYGCTKLNYIKMLATDISATNCLSSWVYNVSSIGTFVKSKDATWNIVGDSSIPEGWTVITDEQESVGKTVNKIYFSKQEYTDIGNPFPMWRFNVRMEYPIASEIKLLVNTEYPVPTMGYFSVGQTEHTQDTQIGSSITINDVRMYNAEMGMDNASYTIEDDTYIYELVIE